MNHLSSPKQSHILAAITIATIAAAIDMMYANINLISCQVKSFHLAQNL